MESELKNALLSKEAGSAVGMESKTATQSTSNSTGEDMISVSLTKKLEEELLKRDTLIEVAILYK